MLLIRLFRLPSPEDAIQIEDIPNILNLHVYVKVFYSPKRSS